MSLSSLLEPEQLKQKDAQSIVHRQLVELCKHTHQVQVLDDAMFPMWSFLKAHLTILAALSFYARLTKGNLDSLRSLVSEVQKENNAMRSVDTSDQVQLLFHEATHQTIVKMVVQIVHDWEHDPKAGLNVVAERRCVIKEMFER